MDFDMNMAPQGGMMAWSEDQSMCSDDGNAQGMAPTSPSPQDNLQSGPRSTKQNHTGQISPVSSAMDMVIDTSTAPTMINSASSSCTDTWSVGFAEREENDNEANWEQDSDDVLTVPKLEPADDDDVNINELKTAPMTPNPQTDEANGAQVKQKRPRGRPRKHPLTPAVPTSKVTKGRSKTGCITCRKRKKKCDEAKPRCMNCEKNAVVCEGYHEKQIWKSGRERAEEERMRNDSQPSITITMPPIFHGVETAEDRVFWKHYINHLSNVLTVEGESRNAFKDIILQLANEHQGLMHSVLAVSSKHINLDEPYGAAILRDNQSTTRESLEERSAYHHDEAMKCLYEDMAKNLDRDDPEYETILSARYAQIMCLLLQTRAEGNPRGEHRIHLQAYKTLMQHSPPADLTFNAFVTEFFSYHIYADDLMWQPETNANRLSSEDWEPPIPLHPPRLLGVADGLFHYLSQITTIRTMIRSNMAAAIDPLVDYTSLYRAAEIDTAIREWAPQWPPGDSRSRVALLYKQVMWVYLFRTIYPPSATPIRRSTFSTFPAMMGQSSMSMMPPRRASMTTDMGQHAVATTPSTPVSHSPSGPIGMLNELRLPRSCPPSRHPSRTNSMHEQDSPRHPSLTPMTPMTPVTPLTPMRNAPARPSSPPPIRRPTHHDRRVTVAVDESLTILESFTPSDPGQALLLIPCMVIGTACFDKAQQERIRTAISAVRGYTGLRNCDRVAEVLEEVWRLMDQGDWISVWDWQSIARRMGMDFLCT